MPFTNYWENKVLDHTTGVASYTAPSGLYVGVSTADPGKTASGLAEPSGNGYARVQATSWASAATGATQTTGSTLSIGPFTTNHGTATYLCIFDASSSGNMLFYGALGTSQSMSSGTTLTIAAGDIDIAFSQS